MTTCGICDALWVFGSLGGSTDGGIIANTGRLKFRRLMIGRSGHPGMPMRARADGIVSLLGIPSATRGAVHNKPNSTAKKTGRFMTALRMH
jgi:hypothetical protein